MKELLEACQKFIAQISPSGDERYYDIDPQDLKEFCDSVEAAQQSVPPTLLTLCPYCKRVHDNRVACPEYIAKSQSGFASRWAALAQQHKEDL